MGKTEDRLKELADKKYAEFAKALIPTEKTYAITGVRMPQLRSLSKEIAKEDPAEAKAFISRKHKTVEEVMTHGMLIEHLYGKDFGAMMEATEKFLPLITNWSICDTYNPKIFLKNKDKTKPFVERWIASTETYTIRFGIVTAMRLYLKDDAYDKDLMQRIASMKSDEYYIKMAIAWFMSYAIIFQYDDAKTVLTSGQMDLWTRNKSIQKAKESFRVSSERKKELETLKAKD